MSEILAHTIAEATKISGLGRTTIYEAIGTGKLEARAGLYFPDTDVMGIFATVGWDVTTL